MARLNFLTACLLPLCCTAPVATQASPEPPAARVTIDTEVSFVVAGKAINQRQLMNGELTTLNFHFYAEIFLKEGQQLIDATLYFPPAEGRPVEAFENQGTLWKLRGERFKTLDEMDRAYPNGDYRFVAHTAQGNALDRTFPVGGSGDDRPIPDPVHITLLQSGVTISAADIDPDQDLTVAWSPFTLGRKDPNGIIDDMIFVSVIDCRGEKVDHSGAAFTEQGALSFVTDHYVVSAALLEPGTIYPMFVEHVLADTQRIDGVPGMVANAATTFLDLKTRGAAVAPCPRILPSMDPGQTDRPGPHEFPD